MVDSCKLSTAIEFLKDALCVKPSVVRDVAIAGHLFKNLPVCECVGKSIESLNEACSATHVDNQRIGKHFFADVMKLATNSGESKAVSSTYCIQVRCSSKVLAEMMKRVLEFEHPDAGAQFEHKEEVVLKKCKAVKLNYVLIININGMQSTDFLC